MMIVIKNMIIFKFEKVNGINLTEENLDKNSLNNTIPILQNNKCVGVVLRSKIKRDKVIGKVIWITSQMKGKPKKKFDDWEIILKDDKYILSAIIVK